MSGHIKLCVFLLATIKVESLSFFLHMSSYCREREKDNTKARNSRFLNFKGCDALYKVSGNRDSAWDYEITAQEISEVEDIAMNNNLNSYLYACHRDMMWDEENSKAYILESAFQKVIKRLDIAPKSLQDTSQNPLRPYSESHNLDERLFNLLIVLEKGGWILKNIITVYNNLCEFKWSLCMIGYAVHI